MNYELKQIWDSVKRELQLFTIDASKLERQLQLFHAFISHEGMGLIEACTGFGKTFIAIIAIKRMNLKRPDFITHVIVPNTSLKEDWTDPEKGYINIYKLRNVKVYVVNSYVLSLQRHKCNLLICDEAHRYANEDAEYFSKVLELTQYNFCMCLSGSMNGDQIKFLESKGIRLIGQVTQIEAEEKGWVSKSIVYNFGIELDEETKDEMEKLTSIINSTFKKLGHDFETARGCSVGKDKIFYGSKSKLKLTGEQWRRKVALDNGWDNSPNHPWHPKEVLKIAVSWNYAVQERQRVLFNYYKKIEIAKEILQKLDMKAIVFSETVSSIEKLKTLLGSECETYHSDLSSLVFKDDSYSKVVATASEIKGRVYKTIEGKFKSLSEIKQIYPNAKLLGKKKLKDLIKDKFKKGLVKYLLTVKSLDEGFDDEDIELGLTIASKGVKRQRIQRDGRVIRAKDGKTAILINLYCTGTQEEKWLSKRQMGIPKSNIRSITTIDEIKVKDIEYDDDFVISQSA